MKVKQDTNSRYGTVYVPIETSMLLTAGGSNSRYDAAKNLVRPVFTHEKYCNAMWMHRKLDLKAVSFTVIKQKTGSLKPVFRIKCPVCLSFRLIQAYLALSATPRHLPQLTLS